MSTLQSRSKVIETRFVWGHNVEACMKKAAEMCQYGRWRIEGNPAPMICQGEYGTGVAISRENDE